MTQANHVKDVPYGVTYNFAAGFIDTPVEFREKILSISTDQLRNFSYKNKVKNGFYFGVIENEEERQQIDKLQELMEKKEFKTRDSCLPVFNTFKSYDDRLKQLRKAKPFDKIDGGRNMIHISKTNEKQLLEYSNVLGSIIRDKIAADLDFSSLSLERRCTRSSKRILPIILTLLETESAIRDDKGELACVPDQLIHCDVNSDDKGLDRADSYIGILATQKGFTELRVVPRSHLMKKQSSYRMPEFVYRVQLPQYYYFVGHPFLLHSGCGSLMRNTRLHFYYGLSQKSQSETAFIDWQLSSTDDKMRKLRAAREAAVGTAANKRKLALIGIS